MAYKELNITNHHLFIDFKAAYNNTTRNEIYGIMAELIPTKLIHLSKATLTTVKCCFKIQNDPFEMRQRLRLEEVLSTLLFKVVLEAMLQLQMTSTIFNMQTQLHAVHDTYLALAAAAKVRPKINEQKTKYMIAVENRTIHDAGQTVAFGNKNCEVV
jgi:hypothetical protein